MKVFKLAEVPGSLSWIPVVIGGLCFCLGAGCSRQKTSLDLHRSSPVVFLSDLKPIEWRSDILPQFNSVEDYQPLRAAGRVYDKGILLFPPSGAADSFLTFDLNGRYQRLEAVAALYDGSARSGSQIFSIERDGETAWVQERWELGARPVEIALDLQGVSRLTLRMGIGGRAAGPGTLLPLLLEPKLIEAGHEPDAVVYSSEVIDGQGMDLLKVRPAGSTVQIAGPWIRSGSFFFRHQGRGWSAWEPWRKGMPMGRFWQLKAAVPQGRGLPDRLSLEIGYRWSSAGQDESSPSKEAAPLNILLVSVDTLRADRLGCYGYPLRTTPVMDRLAAEGVLFSNATAFTPTTNPSHATMLTGRHHRHLRFHYKGERFCANGFPMDEAEVTLAEILREQGYRTASFVSGYPLRSRISGLSQGFDLYEDSFEESQRTARETTDKVLAWLDEGPPNEPFFLFLHYYDPHYLYQAPQEYTDEVTSSGHYWDLMNFRPGHRYDGEVRFVDEQLGRVFDRFREESLWERTLVLLTADHGETIADHTMKSRMILHNHNDVYQTCLWIPLILRNPRRFEAGSVRSFSATLADVLPTLLREAGLKVPEGLALDGVALPMTRAEERRRSEPRPLFSERHNSPLFEERASDFPLEWYSLRLDRWKLIVNEKGWRELFDLAHDPGERQNVILDHPEIARQLQEAVNYHSSQPILRAGDSTFEISEEDEKNLAALGYLR